MFNTSFIKDSENIWREILVTDGTEVFDGSKITVVNGTVTVIYYTSGLYKTEGGYNWYIVNAKESIVDNPILVSRVEQMQEVIDNLLLAQLEGGM